MISTLTWDWERAAGRSWARRSGDVTTTAARLLFERVGSGRHPPEGIGVTPGGPRRGGGNHPRGSGTPLTGGPGQGTGGDPLSVGLVGLKRPPGDSAQQLAGTPPPGCGVTYLKKKPDCGPRLQVVPTADRKEAMGRARRTSHTKPSTCDFLAAGHSDRHPPFSLGKRGKKKAGT